MMSETPQGPVKRSVTIAGHRTSISLEQEFWDALNEMAVEKATSLAGLITIIDETRGRTNLSSALRVAVLKAIREGKL